MTQRDASVAFLHMLDFAEQGLAFVQRRKRSDLDHDVQFRYALTYVILGVGEAANRVDVSVQQEHPDIPWSGLIGMRHRLVHGYDAVNLDRLWQVAHGDLPPLIIQLRRILDGESRA